MKRSKNRLKIRLVRIRRSYSVAEIAALLKVHRQTVRAWHKAGMKPIEESDRPILFLGWEVRKFLQNRRDSKRRRLEDDQFYCTRCREARQSHPFDIQIINTNRLLGGGRKSISIKGRCNICGATVYRFGSFPSLVYDLFDAMITGGKKGLKGNDKVLPNTHLERGHNDESKC
jgi:hypothetical protein